jgi:pimeloyl-ACP methyl ester carboxylesterase
VHVEHRSDPQGIAVLNGVEVNLEVEKRMTLFFRRLRQVWIICGILATIVFNGWSLIAYRASPEAHLALQNDAEVEVTHDSGVWSFIPAQAPDPIQASLLFFPGALVDPIAYAPLARAVAKAGFAAYILELPRRGAFGGADDPQLRTRAVALMRRTDVARRWVLAGHSRGAVIVSELANQKLQGLAGVILIGTSHPRDVNLVSLRIPIMKIIGTRDGLASIGEVEANRDKLPVSTTWVKVEGGNHSQFGWYGFQPGDKRASISPEKQREQMITSVLDMLHSCSVAEPVG